MFPPADDPPDLGIPPNRGPLPVRRNPNSKPNPRVRFGHRRNAQPQGIRGSELTEALYVGFLTGSFIFTALFRICFSHFTEKISRHFQEKALPPYRFQTQAVIRDVSSG